MTSIVAIVAIAIVWKPGHKKVCMNFSRLLDRDREIAALEVSIIMIATDIRTLFNAIEVSLAIMARSFKSRLTVKS